MKSRLGCLSGTGVIAMVVTLMLVVGIGVARGGVLFSPGDLNAQPAARPVGGVFSHADLSGNCSACHPAFWRFDDMNDRCLDCHHAIIEDTAGLHTIIMQGKDLQCRACHPEHRGAQASLTEFSLQEFPHEAVGFSLAAHQETAAGSPFACSDCHVESLARFDQAVCSSCHQELDAAFLSSHLADFGPDCLACHDGVETYGAAFDHAVTQFPLEGQHSEAACADCHGGARNLADLQAASLDCYACHADEDAHNGEFGQDCAACHTPQDWESAQFDHNQTAFPLEGGHIDVTCEACHQDNVYAGTPTACYACHAADDPHNGEFGQDCAACHTPQDWEAAQFDHNLTRFPLEDGHAGVECQACHRDNVFAGTPTECVACHAEPDYHLGLFSQTCNECHTTAAWSPAQYNSPHTFPINHGERGPSECQVCHPAALQTYTCYGCHEHNQANVEREHLEEGIRDFQDCTRCHPTGQEEEGEGREREGGD